MSAYVLDGKAVELITKVEVLQVTGNVVGCCYFFMCRDPLCNRIFDRQCTQVIGL
jgi:hypothetical protein